MNCVRTSTQLSCCKMAQSRSASLSIANAIDDHTTIVSIILMPTIDMNTLALNVAHAHNEPRCARDINE